MNWEQKRVREWVTKHRGILSRIAVICDVSPQFVQQVAYGKYAALPNGQVEKELRKSGWPGINKVATI